MYGAVSKESGTSFTMDSNGDLALNTAGTVGGLEINKDNLGTAMTLSGSSDAVAEAITYSSGASVEDSSAYQKNTGDETDIYRATKEEANATSQNVMANTIRESSPEVTEKVLFNPNAELRGNDLVYGAAVERTHGDLMPNKAADSGFQNVRTYNRPDVPVSMPDGTSHTMSGGHMIEAEAQMENGSRQKLTVSDEAAYTSMSAAERATYTPRMSQTGRSEFYKIEDIPRSESVTPPSDSDIPSYSRDNNYISPVMVRQVSPQSGSAQVSNRADYTVPPKVEYETPSRAQTNPASGATSPASPPPATPTSRPISTPQTTHSDFSTGSIPKGTPASGATRFSQPKTQQPKKKK